MKRLASVCAVAAALAAITAPALLTGHGNPREDPDHAWAEDTLFTVNQVRPGVYFATGQAGRVVGANSVFIVTDRDVVVVDDHITPRAARALQAEIRRVTDKPVRYVVNTHFHYDHISGNGVFGPETELLSHPRTRQALIDRGQATIGQQVIALPTTIATLRARRDTTHSDSLRILLTRQIAETELTLDEYRSLAVVLPTMTVDSSLVLYRGGGQEIRVFYMGRGHTAGDVVVQLPREGLMLAGDLVTNTAGLPNMMDGYAGEWGATLRRLAQIDFTTTLPGHGSAFDGKQRYLATADAMDDIWQQVRAAQQAGVEREAIAGRLDLSRHLGVFPGLRNGLNPVWAQRVWDLAAGHTN